MQELLNIVFFTVFGLNGCYVISFMKVMRRLGRPWGQMNAFSRKQQIVDFLLAEVAQGQGDAKLALCLYRISNVLTPVLVVLMFASLIYHNAGNR